MSVVLLILKIIGIALLAVLGLLILAIMAILYWPIRYRIRGAVEDDFTVRISISWLFHIYSCRWDLVDNEFVKERRLFGFRLKEEDEEDEDESLVTTALRILVRPEKKVKSEKMVKDKKPKYSKPPEVKTLTKEVKSSEPKSLAESIKPPEVKPSAESIKPPEVKASAEAIKPPEVKPSMEAVILPEVKPSEEAEEEKKSARFGKIKNVLRMLKNKKEMLKEKASNLWKNIRQILQEIRDESNRAAVVTIFKELKYLLIHILPRKVKGDISFGMEDPATTGQILGAISMVPLVYRYNLHIFPDFEAESFYFKGNLDIKGNIRIVYVLTVVFHLIMDKNVQSLLQRYGNL